MPHTEALVRRYIDAVWNRGDRASLDALTTPTFDYTLGSQAPRDRKGLAEFIAAMLAAFPDWKVEIDQTITQDDTVAVRWHARPTHLGPFRGLAPTGRRVMVSGINMYAVEGDRIAREWEQTDSLGLLQQLGALPS